LARQNQGETKTNELSSFFEGDCELMFVELTLKEVNLTIEDLSSTGQNLGGIIVGRYKDRNEVVGSVKVNLMAKYKGIEEEKNVIVEIRNYHENRHSNKLIEDAILSGDRISDGDLAALTLDQAHWDILIELDRFIDNLIIKSNN
jgi:hypothetical protein